MRKTTPKLAFALSRGWPVCLALREQSEIIGSPRKAVALHVLAMST